MTAEYANKAEVPSRRCFGGQIKAGTGHDDRSSTRCGACIWYNRTHYSFVLVAEDADATAAGYTRRVVCTTVGAYIDGTTASAHLLHANAYPGAS